MYFFLSVLTIQTTFYAYTIRIVSGRGGLCEETRRATDENVSLLGLTSSYPDYRLFLSYHYRTTSCCLASGL